MRYASTPEMNREFTKKLKLVFAFCSLIMYGLNINPATGLRRVHPC